MRAAVCGSALLLFLVAGPGFGAHAQVKSRFEDPSLANPQVVLREIEFAGAVQLPLDVQEAARADLIAREYMGTNWQGEISERIRDAWQQNGYFKVDLSLDHEVLRREGTRLEVVVVARIEEGLLYRFGEIRWRNLNAFSAVELSPLFPLVEGDVFNTAKIRQGLEALREAYSTRGYINFTPVPETEVDDEKQLINLMMNLDEGELYRLGSVEVHATDERLVEQLISAWKLKIGDGYDARLVEAFFLENQQVLPPDFSPNEGVQIRQDARTKEVHIRIFLDMSPLPDPKLSTIQAEEDAPLLRSRD